MRIMTTVGLLAATLAPGATAQGKGGGIAVIPFVGYSLAGGNLAEDTGNDIQLKPKGALVLGAQFELGLSKNIGIDVGVNRTFSQTLDEIQAGTSFGEDDMSMTQITGSIIIRPGGRNPNGAVTPLFLEVGGGVTLYTIGSAALPNSDFNSTQPMGFVGAGYNFPIGPRATVQVFGRAQMIGPYSSTGLDDFNAQPPVTAIEGKAMLNFQFGAALRVGR